MEKIKNHVLVNGIKVNKATVVSDSLLKAGSCIPGSKITPTSITFHQTDCYDVDTPRMALALKNANNDPYAGTSKSNYRKASWHITVGHNKIIQNIPLNWKAYAQGCTSGNNTSISIEMCMYNDKAKQYNTYLNAIALFKLLKTEYKSSLVAKAHYDWTEKNCPSWLRAGKFGYSWTWFKNKLVEKDTVKVEYKQLKNGDYNKKAKVVCDSLNVRKSRPNSKGDLGAIDFSLKKGEIVTLGYVYNGWGSIWHEGESGFVNTSNKYIELI